MYPRSAAYCTFLHGKDFFSSSNDKYHWNHEKNWYCYCRFSPDVVKTRIETVYIQRAKWTRQIAVRRHTLSSQLQIAISAVINQSLLKFTIANSNLRYISCNEHQKASD